MRYDCAASTQQNVRKMLALDPRVVKFGVVKMGRTLEEIKGVEGAVRWRMKDGGFG